MHQRLFDIVSSVRADQVRVQTSNELRTQQSAGEYLAGFLNFLPDSDRPTYSILPPNEDYLLKSADICPKYVEVIFMNIRSLFQSSFLFFSFFKRNQYTAQNRRNSTTTHRCTSSIVDSSPLE